MLQRNLPLEQRTIQKIQIGGIAGGDKYVHDGIMFKFAARTEITEALYPTDECAMKVANAELNGLMACIDCNIVGLSFPLMALIDYAGYRVIATSLLPISKDTLVYGSRDGGVTVVDKSEDAKQKLKQVRAAMRTQCSSCAHSAVAVKFVN